MFRRRDQLAYGCEEFLYSFGRERGLAVLRANPGINIRHADRNPILVIFECRWLPLLQDFVFATSWNRRISHHCYLIFLRRKGGLSHCSSSGTYAVTNST